MKCHKTICVLVLGIILSPLVAFPVTSAHAAGGDENITLNPDEGNIRERIYVESSYFEEGELFHLYFSSDVAEEGDKIDDEVTHYKLLEGNIRASHETSPHPGKFDIYFEVPEELDDGENEEDVHCGDYYVYATYRISKDIIAVARFTVIGCKIEVDPDEGTVGSEVEIIGEGLGNNQEITVKYEGDEVDIISGDAITGGDGQFMCTIIIPESMTGSHTITVTDESGNKPETEFSIRPKITVEPASQAIDETVNVSGAGFEKRERITITFDGHKVITTPISLHTNLDGSFGGSFVLPLYPDYAKGGVAEIEARDESLNVAETELTVLAILANISLYPPTNRTSPGHVGMELTVNGIWFIADTTVTITYSDGETLTVATATADENRNFSTTFTVPPSAAGSHAVTATDGTNSVTSIFTVESEAPPMPVMLLPEVTATVEGETYFDWEDVTDPSGVTYVLQIAADSDFAAIVLEKKGLTDSEYTLTEGEKLESTGKESPYYWRVKSVDGTFDESGWTAPSAFYVGISWTSIPSWLRYIWIGVGVSVALILIFRLRRRHTE